MKILVIVVWYQCNEYMEYHSFNFLMIFVFQLQVSILILKFFSFLGSVLILKIMFWNITTLSEISFDI